MIRISSSAALDAHTPAPVGLEEAAPTAASRHTAGGRSPTSRRSSQASDSSMRAWRASPPDAGAAPCEAGQMSPPGSPCVEPSLAGDTRAWTSGRGIDIDIDFVTLLCKQADAKAQIDVLHALLDGMPDDAPLGLGQARVLLDDMLKAADKPDQHAAIRWVMGCLPDPGGTQQERPSAISAEPAAEPGAPWLVAKAVLPLVHPQPMLATRGLTGGKIAQRLALLEAGVLAAESQLDGSGPVTGDGQGHGVGHPGPQVVVDATGDRMTPGNAAEAGQGA